MASLRSRIRLLVPLGMRKRRWLRSAGPVPGTEIEAPDGSTVFASGYEPEMTAAVTRLTQPGHVCADAGAHFGWFTVLMAARVGESGHVHSFEASAGNAAIVTRNAKLNGQSDRVTLHVAAVADEALPEVDLFAARAGGSMEWTLIQRFAEREGPVSSDVVEHPPSVTLDDEFPPGSQLDVVKMDIEGAEVLALKGGRRVLREQAPVIVLEYHRDVAWPAIAELTDAGYSFESLGGDPIPVPQATKDVPYQFVARPPAGSGP